MLVINDLTVRYAMHEALTSVSLKISRDEIVVILGANGAGKSTLLSAIAGNCAGQISGSVILDGEPLENLDAAQIVERGIAYVPEGRGVFADLSVEENLQLGAYTEHARRTEQQSLGDVLTLFPKLEDRKKQIVRTMSGGEQQMVAIGRALMSAPSILMLDEPSLGLSPLLCKELFSSLEYVRASGVGILLVEQNAKQSLGISDRGYLLGNGKIIGHDNAQDLLGNPEVQSAYLGGSITKQTSSPKTTVVSESIDSAKHDEVGSTHRTIHPAAKHGHSPTVSSDSLVSGDINEMVARASSAATEMRDIDAALPVQVIKLSANQSQSVKRRDRAGSQQFTIDSSTGKDSQHRQLPATNDVEVQAMLDEFEIAAQSAARGSIKASKNSTKSVKPSKASTTRDDELPLPHIPVFKKSSVTVYRRDGSGKLRKQD